jgi:D-sedoheptulose 7-phosphate isomerase
MNAAIEAAVAQAVEAASRLQEPEALTFIESVAEAIADCYKRDGKLILAGNGGSLCDAMHFAEEMTGYFRHKRPALPAIVLSEPGHITCVGNDEGFDAIFARGVEAHGKPGDLLIVLTTSGNSPNLVAAVDRALEMGLTTIAFLGKGGGRLRGRCDFEWSVDGFTYSDRVQEAHMAAIHIIIEQVETHLFSHAHH